MARRAAGFSPRDRDEPGLARAPINRGFLSLKRWAPGAAETRRETLSMAKEEQVLVVGRDVFEQAGVFHGLTFDVARYVDAFFAPGVPRFMARSRAEVDPSFKQIIPYVVMVCDGTVLSYVRGKRGGESRLHDRRSIGIGGHVNPADDMPLYSHDDPGEMFKTYQKAVEREVDEEVVFGAGVERTERIVALINDDSTEVGRVHVGIVHVWELSSPRVARREQAITQLSFLPPRDLRSHRDAMESWSMFCLDHLDELMTTAGSGRTR